MGQDTHHQCGNIVAHLFFYPFSKEHEDAIVVQLAIMWISCVCHNIGKGMCSDIFDGEEAVPSDQWANDSWNLARLSNENGQYIGLSSHCIGSLV